MDNKRKNGFSARKTVLSVLCVFLSVVLILMLGGTIYMESLLRKINRVETSTTGATLSSSEVQDILNGQNETVDPNYTGATMSAEDVTWAPDVTEPIGQGENVINILLIGQDRRPGEVRARSDAMILCTINKEKKTLTLTSIMRDLYVQIPGYSDDRINVSYVLGGMPLLNACIEKNFGISVDGNVEVDFSGFETVVDLVGGLEIELSKAEASHLNSQNSNWSLKAGTNHLDGAQALAYSRIRSISNDEVGDFGRTGRQRIVLSKLVQKAKTMSLLQLNDMLTKVLPTLTTDLTDAEIFKYLVDLFPLLVDLKINTTRIPADGAYFMTMIDGKSVLVPDLEANREILKKIISP